PKKTADRIRIRSVPSPPPTIRGARRRPDPWPRRSSMFSLSLRPSHSIVVLPEVAVSRWLPGLGRWLLYPAGEPVELPGTNTAIDPILDKMGLPTQDGAASAHLGPPPGAIPAHPTATSPRKYAVPATAPSRPGSKQVTASLAHRAISRPVRGEPAGANPFPAHPLLAKLDMNIRIQAPAGGASCKANNTRWRDPAHAGPGSSEQSPGSPAWPSWWSRSNCSIR